MNFIRKNKNTISILCILIIIYCINKKIINKNLKNVLNKCFNLENFNIYSEKNCDIDNNNSNSNVPSFNYDSQKDFSYHSENLKTSEAEQLYDFLQSTVTPNHNMYDLTASSTKMYKSDSESNENLLSFIKIKFNKKVKNIKLLDKIFYFKNNVYLDIKPFQIEGDYINNNNNYGKVKIQIELTFRFDQPTDIFISNIMFNKHEGVFKINRAILINHKSIPEKVKLPLTYDDMETDITKKNLIYDFTYDTNNLDTINSIIPEDINITECEPFSND